MATASTRLLFDQELRVGPLAGWRLSMRTHQRYIDGQGVVECFTTELIKPDHLPEIDEAEAERLRLLLPLYERNQKTGYMVWNG